MRCKICGRPLKGVASMRTGIGPVCRAHRKTERMQEKLVFEHAAKESLYEKKS